jgi:hypothetical protein
MRLARRKDLGIAPMNSTNLDMPKIKGEGSVRIGKLW